MKNKKLVIAIVLIIGVILIATPALAASGFYGPRADGTGKFQDNSKHEFIADKLGLSSDELCELRTSGKTLEDLAAAKGIDITELRGANGQGLMGKQMRGQADGQGQGYGKANGMGKGHGYGQYNQFNN